MKLHPNINSFECIHGVDINILPIKPKSSIDFNERYRCHKVNFGISFIHSNNIIIYSDNLIICTINIIIYCDYIIISRVIIYFRYVLKSLYTMVNSLYAVNKSVYDVMSLLYTDILIMYCCSVITLCGTLSWFTLTNMPCLFRRNYCLFRFVLFSY